MGYGCWRPLRITTYAIGMITPTIGRAQSRPMMNRSNGEARERNEHGRLSGLAMVRRTDNERSTGKEKRATVAGRPLACVELSLSDQPT
jgi:hypothetical protein